MENLKLSFEGDCAGNTPGMPYAPSTYPTCRDGELQNFFISDLKIGDIFYFGKEEFVVTRNYYSKGTPAVASQYFFEASPKNSDWRSLIRRRCEDRMRKSDEYLMECARLLK
jgi:hypothetical protein